jgi:hypothetical protein
MKIRETDFADDLCISDKLSTGGFGGATYAQTIGATEDIVGSALVEYSVNCAFEKWAKHETRGYREVQRSRGRPVAQVGKYALRDELIILPGAAMSASDVIRALRKYIEHVAENGMYIGRYTSAFIIEKVDGSIEAIE